MRRARNLSARPLPPTRFATCVLSPRACALAADPTPRHRAGVRHEPGRPRPARDLRPAPLSRGRAPDHARLDQRLLERPMPHGELRPLPPVLDAGPVLQLRRPGKTVGASPRRRAPLARLGDPDLASSRQPRHDHDPLLRPAGGHLRLRGGLPSVPAGRPSSAGRRGPPRAKPDMADRRGRALPRPGGRPGDRPGAGGSTRRIETRWSTDATRTATRWSRCLPRRFERSTGASRPP